MENCYFPPYWLKIDDKKEDQQDEESYIKKIKVVSHCENTAALNYYLLKEYLAYKIFNIITDYSFKVKLLKIKYIDTGREGRISEYWGFLIEPEDIMAERLNAYPIKMDNASYSLTDTLNTATMNIFQYMIGNTDYSITGRHNMKILKPKDHMKLYLTPVPYDFDFSGLVNAHYAKPSPKTGLKNVTERYFYGLCKSDETFNLVINQFQNKRNEIKNYILSFSYLNKREREKVWEYIEEFYQETENEHFIDRKIRRTCKQ